DAGRTWRYTASEDRANRLGTVANVETAPSRTHTNATPNGHRRRHHNETQHSAPSTASVATFPDDRRGVAPSTVTVRVTTPSTTATANAVESTSQSRVVRGPTASVGVGSSGPDTVGAVRAHHLDSQDIAGIVWPAAA